MGLMETNNNIKDLNIAEILRYAPKMLELFSPIYGEVYFDYVNEEGTDIHVKTKLRGGSVATFNANGTYYDFPNSECLLFPSASHRCWNNWNSILFQKGDIVKDKIGVYIYCNPDYIRSDGHTAHMGGGHKYASPEEAKEFFEELNKNGYEWNGKMVVKSTSQPKFNVGDCVVNNNSGDVFQVTEIKDDEYCLWPFYGEICGHLRIIDVDTDYHLWTIDDAKDGDILTNDYNSTFIFKEEYIAGKPTAYCGIIDGDFFAKTSGCWTNEKCYPATKGQTDFLFQKMKEKGYKWDVDAKKLIKTTIPIPKFRIDDIIKHKSTGQINTIKYVCSDYYILDNNNALFFESQDMWELAASKVEVTPQDKVPTSLEVYHAVNNIKSLGNKVSILADEILALKERVKALEIQAIRQCSDKAGDNVTLEEMKG